MALTQDRIRDLVTYIQLDPGDSGYVASSSLYFAMDSADFGSKPFKFPVEDLLSDAHDEKARLIGLVSASVSITFGTAFTATPLPILFNVYRYTEIVSGKWVKENVNHHLTGGSSWLNSTGFSITIDSSESLTGVIIEYKFEEA